MVETGAITEAAGRHAPRPNLSTSHRRTSTRSEAPYFVDLVHDQLVQRIGDQDCQPQSLRIYTSLDPDLQRAASEAVESACKNVDELVRKQHKTPQRRKAAPSPITYPQVALVAINPHTGQVLALVGGRNYGVSQLNHAVANRPTGSIFKPFVYAAAFNTSPAGTALPRPRSDALSSDRLTHRLDRRSTTHLDLRHRPHQHFYTPEQLRRRLCAAQLRSHGLREVTALCAAVLAQQRHDRARPDGRLRQRGRTRPRRRHRSAHAARPSVAIGAYDATPIDMAGAYTVFANNGVHLESLDARHRPQHQRRSSHDYTPEAKQVLDPRVAYLTTNMLEGA